MKVRTINIKHEKYSEEVTRFTHFGWEVISYSHTAGSKHGQLSLRYNNPQHASILRKLEKQEKAINRHLPWGAMITCVLGVACLVCYFQKVTEYYGFFLAGAILFFAIMVACTLNFILLKVYKSKLLFELYKAGDELSGKIISRPIPSNIIMKDKYTRLIKKNLYEREKLKS